MENIDQPSGKKNKQILIIVAAIVLCLPIAFILLKRPSQNRAANAPAAPVVDVAALESVAKATPNYINLVNLAVAYINTNAPGRSIPYLKKAIKLDSTKALAYNDLGVANIQLRNFNAGIAACEKAVSLDSKFQLAKNNLKWGIDEKNKALTMISKLESTPADKMNIEYFTQLGLNYLYVGDYQKSIVTWNSGLAKYNDNAIFINDIGTALVMLKQYDKAVDEFNLILKKDPTNQLAKNNIAWALDEKANAQ